MLEVIQLVNIEARIQILAVYPCDLILPLTLAFLAPDLSFHLRGVSHPAHTHVSCSLFPSAGHESNFPVLLVDFCFCSQGKSAGEAVCVSHVTHMATCFPNHRAATPGLYFPERKASFPEWWGRHMIQDCSDDKRSQVVYVSFWNKNLISGSLLLTWSKQFSRLRSCDYPAEFSPPNREF